MAVKSDIIFKLRLALIPLRVFSSGKEITQVCTGGGGAVAPGAFWRTVLPFPILGYESAQRAEHAQAAAPQR